MLLLQLTLLPLSFSWSSLCYSSANASLLTSLLQSNLSAPCGVIPHSSIRTLQRSEWACSRLLSLIALQPGHSLHCGSELVNVLICLFLSEFVLLQKAGIGIGSTRFAGLSTVFLPSVILRGTPMTHLMVFLSHLLCGSILLMSRALNTPTAVPKKHSVLLLLVPNKIPNSFMGFILLMGSVKICLDNTFSPIGTNSCDGFLRCNVSKGALTNSLTPGQDANCVFHTTIGPPGVPPLPTIFLVFGQECDWSGANCTGETAAKCSSTGWRAVAVLRVGRPGTNKFRNPPGTYWRQQIGHVASDRNAAGLEGSPPTKWTTPLRTLMTTGKSETLRNFPRLQTHNDVV